MASLIPNDRDFTAGSPVFKDSVDALSYWEQKFDGFFTEYGHAAEVEDFVTWAVSSGCPPGFAYIALKGGDDFDPVLSFNALRTICIENIGLDAAREFFNDFLKIPIYADDCLKKFAFLPDEARYSIDYCEAIGAKKVICYIRSDSWLCHKHDGMVFTVEDAYKFEKLKCDGCLTKWVLYNGDKLPSSMDEAVQVAGIWVTELYHKADSFLATGKFTQEDCDEIVELYNSAYCPPHSEALKFRGIGEVLMAKGDILGAIESFETALLWDEHIGVKRKLKALYSKAEESARSVAIADARMKAERKEKK